MSPCTLTMRKDVYKRQQQDMGMGIVSGGIWVVDGSISAHSVCYKLLLDEILQELDLFLSLIHICQSPLESELRYS